MGRASGSARANEATCDRPASFWIRMALAVLAAACCVALTRGTALGIDNAAVTVRATLLSNSNCRFRAPGTATLNFGTLDPANAVDVTVTAGMEIRCGGAAGTATYLIVDDDGLYESGPNAHRMRHAVNAGAFLPYSFSYASASATIPRNVNTPITVSGTVLGTSYQNALVGIYSDTVILTIVP